MGTGPISEELYQHLALVDHEGHWELHYGRLRAKPAGTVWHNEIVSKIGFGIANQPDHREFAFGMNGGRVRRTSQHYYIPDFIVMPRRLTSALLAIPESFEVYDEPLPLIVEAWSRPIPEYDWDDLQRIEHYRLRGDTEIWLVNPTNRTLRAFRKQPDNTYTETVYRGGKVQPVALPNVTIDLDELFNL
jgi:hypothetical protein